MAHRSSMASLLECPVCLDQFADPRTLTPCLHTLCYKCLQSHIARTGKNGQFQCPECMGRIPIPEDGADSFGKDFFIKRYIDVALQPETGARSKTGQLTQRAGKEGLCSNSEEGDDCGERETFCLECCKYYCNVCSRVHSKSKATRSHILVQLAKLTDEMLKEAMAKSQAPRCLRHVNEPLEVFCTACQHAVCYSSHILREISDIDQNFKAELKPSRIIFERLIRDSQEGNAKITQLQLAIKNNTTTARDTTTRVFQRMRWMLMLTKAKEIDNNISVHVIKEEGVSRLGTPAKNQEYHTELVQSLYSFAQDLLKTGTVFNRLASLPDVRSHLQELKSSPADGVTHTETASSAALVAEQLDCLVLRAEFNLGGPGSDGPILEMKYICSVKKTKTRQVRDSGRCVAVSPSTSTTVAPHANRPKGVVWEPSEPKLTVLLYSVSGYRPVFVADARRAVSDVVYCDVTETQEKQLRLVTANSLQVDVIVCLGKHIKYVEQTYQLNQRNTAGRHLVFIHWSNSGSQEKTLQLLGDCRDWFELVIQYDGYRSNSGDAAARRLADYFRQVSQS